MFVTNESTIIEDQRKTKMADENEKSQNYPWVNWNNDTKSQQHTIQHHWKEDQIQNLSSKMFESEVILNCDEDLFSGNICTTDCTKNNCTKESEQGFFDLYYEYSDKIVQNHGERAICLIEEGSFYAILGYWNDKKFGPSKTGERAEEVAAVCGLQSWVQKKTTDFERWSEVPSEHSKVSRYRPLRVGFPTCSADKYIKMLTEEGFWIAFMNQHVTGHTNSGKKIIKRTVDKIIHKSMDLDRLSADSQHEKTNMAIYTRVTAGSKLRSVGIAVVNLESSTWEIYESISTPKEPEKAIEDIERLVVQHKPSLVIWFGDVSEKQRIYEMPKNTEERFEKLSQKLRQRSYQEQFLHTIMIHNYKKEYLHQNLKSMYLLDMFHLMDTVDGTIAYFHLLEFYFKTEKRILEMVSPPNIIQDQSTLILERNAAEELDLCNLCDMLSLQTKMGKHLMKNRIFRPSTNIQQIMELYNFTASCESHVTQKLRISDLPRIYRRMASNKCTLDNLQRLYQDCKLINNIQHPDIDWNIQGFLDEMESNIDFEYLEREANPVCYFLKSDNQELLDIQKKLQNMHESLKMFEILISQKTGDHENCGHRIEKGSKSVGKRMTFGGPKKHFNIVKALFEQSSHKLGKFVWNKESVTITSNNQRYFVRHFMIESDYPDLLAEVKELQQQEIKKLGKFLYEKWKTVLEKMSYDIARLDIGIATWKFREKHGLITPTFVDPKETGNQSFYEAKDLRNIMIESMLTNTSYVPNDFEAGTKETVGMALYGLNSSGKSSGMRAVGLAIILSQTGIGVPATSFRMCPFKNIMSRILGGNSKDEQRLSSFQIEISELKPICYRANSNTLVLGDEIAHSTEVASGSCLVASVLDHLVRNRIPFILATHQRSLCDLIEPETKLLTKIRHFKVDIDYINKTLNFDRKLQDGMGLNLYGIQIAEHMGLNSNICRAAREKLYKLEKKPESLIGNHCRYNSKKIMSPICESPGCTKPVEQHDHIYPQQICDNNLQYQYMKNQPSNLQSLCHEHHVQKTSAEKSLKRKLGETTFHSLSPENFKKQMLEEEQIFLK